MVPASARVKLTPPAPPILKLGFLLAGGLLNFDELANLRLEVDLANEGSLDEIVAAFVDRAARLVPQLSDLRFHHLLLFGFLRHPAWRHGRGPGCGGVGLMAQQSAQLTGPNG